MTDNKRVAISIQNVSKDFKLPHHNQPSSIKSIFVNPFSSKKEVLKEGTEKQHALKNISFDIYEGEFFGIVGKNGSGKSTLLKIIAGIYKPNKGKVKYKGKLVPFIELGVGFNPELSGRDNVYLSGALMGFSTREVKAKYNQIVEFAELERFMDQRLKNYSSGMQVRLAFSVATILGDSDILLIDEVLAVGDADFQRKCFNYFKKLKKLKKTVVFVSHDMTAVREFCERAVLIDENKIIKIGSATEISTLYSNLFISDEPTTHPQPSTELANEERKGDGRVKIKNVAWVDSPNNQITKDIRSLTFTIESFTDDMEIIAGFRVEDSTGSALFGTNTQIEKNEIPILNKNESCQITWQIPNILSDGDYSITLSLHSHDAASIYDYWPSAVVFSVKRPQRVPYAIYPDINVRIDIEKS